MTYAGSCLTQKEWDDALVSSVAEHRAYIEQQLLTGPVPPEAAPDLEARVMNHLTKIASIDKAYAWWSSHLYQRLGASELNEDAFFKDAPDALTRTMNSQKLTKNTAEQS